MEDGITSCPEFAPKYQFCLDSDWWKEGISYSDVIDRAAESSSPPSSPLEREFNERADRWERESAVHSSPSATYLYRDYIAIMGIGMTDPATIVPLILNRIPTTGSDWFFALETITGENPAKNLEDFENAYTAWCAWAERKGFVRP